MKTNAARLLDTLGIRYELRSYEVDPTDLAATSVARKIGLPPEQVFKTLLTRADGDPAFALVAANADLHLKHLAALAGARKVELMPLIHVEPLTGYIRGGVTVLGAKKAFPVYTDELLMHFDLISVSAGARGTQLVLNPQDYLRAIERNTGHAAVLGNISQPQAGAEVRP
jgi:Cys-tRNA(Pro)/Cys-tRNA(Cys) deacylase